MSIPTPPFYGIDWNDNDHLEYTDPVTGLLYDAQFRVDEWIRLNAGLHVFSLRMLTEFHRLLFEDVWPEFAGKLRGRGPNQIARNVSIGSLAPGVHADEVLAQTSALATTVAEYIRTLDERLGALEPAEAVESARNIAAYLHCELIRIHPFVNGNGRTSRTCINYIGQRYGLRFVQFERSPEGEYKEAVRTYIRQNGHYQHFADFLGQYW